MRLWKFIVRWKWSFLFIVAILYFVHKILTEKTKAIPDFVILGLMVIAARFYWNYFYKINIKDKLRLLVNTQKICFPLVFIALIFGRYIPDILFTLLLVVGINGISSSIILKRSISVKHNKKDTLEETIKKDLKINSKTYRKAFFKPFGFIGGFVTPIFPFFTMLNKSWKKCLDKEALIHENIHLYYLQNGLIFAILFGSLIVSLPVYFVFNDSVLIMNLASYAYFVCTLVLFEFITFRKTNIYSEKLGIKTRKWDKGICIRYFVIYAVQIGIIMSIVTLFLFIGRKIIEAIL